MGGCSTTNVPLKWRTQPVHNAYTTRMYSLCILRDIMNKGLTTAMLLTLS